MPGKAEVRTGASFRIAIRRTVGSGAGPPQAGLTPCAPDAVRASLRSLTRVPSPDHENGNYNCHWPIAVGQARRLTISVGCRHVTLLGPLRFSVRAKKQKSIEQGSKQRDHVDIASQKMTTKLELGRATLGVVGGGQLGRMMSWPCHRMGKLCSPFPRGPATRKALFARVRPAPARPRLRFALVTLCAVRTVEGTCRCSGRQEEGCFFNQSVRPGPPALRASSSENGRTFSAEMG